MCNKDVVFDSAARVSQFFCEEAIEEPVAGNDAGLADDGLTVVGFDLASSHELTWVGYYPSQMRVFYDRPYFKPLTHEVLIGRSQLGINQGLTTCRPAIYVEVLLTDCDDLLAVSTVSRYLVIDGVSYLHQLGEMPLPEDVAAALAEYHGS